MNRIKLIAVLLLLHCSCFAQKNLFLQPYIGAGVTELEGTVFSKGFGDKKSLSLTGGIQIGTQKGHWRFSTGLSILKTGCIISPVFEYDPFTGYARNNRKVSIAVINALLPIKVGYTIEVGKLSVVPSLGIAAAYHLKNYATFEELATGKRETSAVRAFAFKRFSGFGIADISLIRKVNERISLSGGVSYHQMFTNNMQFYTLPFSNEKYQPPAMLQYALTGNFGVIFKL